jgi:parallel beta-helix repeat protein
MKLTQTFLTALFIVAMGSYCNAEVLRVPSSGMNSILEAFVQAQPGDTVLVRRGIYEESLLIPPDVVVKAEDRHKVILDGGGRGTVVELNQGSVIDGLVIKNGTIGVFSKSQNAVIKNCQIVQNWMTGVISVRYIPQMEDNLIAFNRSSGIVTWDARSTTGEIEYNTISHNGGFGLWLGGESEVTFQKNIVAYNQKYGAQWSNESAASIIRENNFWENLKQFYEYPAGNYQFRPDFRSPKVGMDFRRAQGCCAVKSRDGSVIGIRYTE